MRNKILIMALMAFSWIAVACSGQNEPSMINSFSLDGTGWTLASLKGQAALKETTITINFAAGKFTGSDGCNGYAGSYTADATNNKLDQPFASTMMACPELITNQATAYL